MRDELKNMREEAAGPEESSGFMACVTCGETAISFCTAAPTCKHLLCNNHSYWCANKYGANPYCEKCTGESLDKWSSVEPDLPPLPMLPQTKAPCKAPPVCFPLEKDHPFYKAQTMTYKQPPAKTQRRRQGHWHRAQNV